MLATQKMFLSRSEVARELGLSSYLVSRAIAKGELRATKLAGRVFIARIRVEEWLTTQDRSAGERNGDDVCSEKK